MKKITDWFEKLKNMFPEMGVQLKTRNAYRACFKRDGKLTHSGQIVLQNLIDVCSIYDSTVSTPIDPLLLAYKEGQRSVFNNIQWYLNVDQQELINNFKKMAYQNQNVDFDEKEEFIEGF